MCRSLKETKRPGSSKEDFFLSNCQEEEIEELTVKVECPSNSTTKSRPEAICSGHGGSSNKETIKIARLRTAKLDPKVVPAKRSRLLPRLSSSAPKLLPKGELPNEANKKNQTENFFYGPYQVNDTMVEDNIETSNQTVEITELTEEDIKTEFIEE